MATYEYKDIERYRKGYENGMYPQPVSQERGEKFFLDWCNFVYSCYSFGTAQNINGGLVRDGRSIAELRAYAIGQQSTSKYRAWLDVEVSENGMCDAAGRPIDRKSIMNISWDNVRVLPPMLDIALSKILEPQYEPTVRATDTIAQKKKRDKYVRDKLVVDPRMKALFAATGIKPEGVSGNYQDMDSGDVDVLQELGGYGLAVEALMQDVVGASLSKAGHEELNIMLARDALNLNQMHLHVFALPGQKRVGLKYVDPAGVISPVSSYNDCRDRAYVANIEHVSISQLREESGLDEKTLYKIAKSYSSYHGNAKIRAEFKDFTDRGWREDFVRANGRYPYDNFSVCVMNLYFKCLDAENYLVGINDDGSMMFEKTDTYGEGVQQRPIQYVYKCRWVVGTQCVFDYGKDDTIVRVGESGSKEACLPILSWVGDGPSIVERCISIVDDFQQAMLKLRAVFNNMPPGPRLRVDLTRLEQSVKLGNATLNIKDQLKLYSGRGVFLYRSRTEFADPSAIGSQGSPIESVESGAQEDFNLFSAAMQSSMALLRQATGINEVADGSASGNRMLIGVMEGLAQASNEVLKPYMAGAYSMYKRTVGLMARKYQLLAMDGTIEMKYWPLDGDTIKTLTLEPDIALYDFEVEARLLPTKEEVQMITQSVFMRQQEGKLTEADAFIILSMLKNKDTTKAKIYMARAVAKREAQLQQQQESLMDRQAQGNIEAAKAGEEARANTSAMEIEGQMRLEQQKHGHKMAELEKQSQLRQQEFVAQGLVKVAAEGSVVE